MADINTELSSNGWTGTPGVNLTVPKPGENPYNIPSPFGNKPTPNSPNYLNPSLVGSTAAETAANFNKYVSSNVDYNNYAKATAFDAGPNGANLERYKGYGDKFYKIGFDPTINNESKFINNTTWWDDTKRMLTNSFLPLYGEGLKANLKSYLDIGDGDFGQDIRAAADYEKASNIGYSTRGGIMPFISNTAMSFAYTGGILTQAVAETFLLRKMSPAVFGGKDSLVNLLKAPKDIAAGIKGTAEYLKDMKNIEVARSAYSKALQSGWNFINPINHSWDNFITNVANNKDDITALARAQRTFGAFYKDIRNMNMALSESKLEGGFAQNKTLNDLYNDHYFRTGEVPDEATMKLYQEKAEAAGFSATMQNLGLVFYTNKITLPTLMKFGPFKALDDVGRELAEGTLLREGSGLAAKTVYSPRTFMQSFKNLAKPSTWGRGGLNYFKANLLEGVQENLQDVIADSTQAYFTNSIFQPERGKYEMYMAGLKDGFAKQWSHQGLETFASGFLMGFGNTIVEGTVQNILKAGNYLTQGKGYTNYLNERHAGGQELADIVNFGLNPTKFFGSNIFDLGNQALAAKDIDSKDTNEKEKIDTKTTSLISSVLAALDTGTFDMHIDNLEGLKQMTETEIEDTFKLKAGEGKKALERIDKIIDKAKAIQRKYEYHNENFQLKINVNDYKEGTIEREQAELMVEAHRRSKFNAIFLDASYEDNLNRINSIGKTFQDFSNYVKSDSKIMMSDLEAIYNRESLQSQIKLLESEIASMEGLTDPEIVVEKERKAKILARLQKYDKAQSAYDAVEKARLDGSFAFNKYLKEEVLKQDDLTEEEKKAIEESDEQLLKKIQELEENYKQGLKDYLIDLVGGDVSYEEALRNAQNDKALSIDDAFTQLKDLTKLDVENQKMIKYMSVLNNPAGYMEHVQRNYKWMKALYTTRKEHIRQMIENALQTKEYKDLLQSLADDGVYIDLDEFAKWIKDKSYQPKEFIDGTKEMVIPKGSDSYMKYYMRFIQVARAQEERIAEEKINKEQSLKDRTEELNRMKQKELDDARVVYLRELKSETGSSEAELIKAMDEFIEKNLNNKDKIQEDIDNIATIRTLLQSVNSPALMAAFYQVRDKAFAEDTLDQSVYDSLLAEAMEDEAQLAEIKKIEASKTKSIEGASPDDILMFSINFHIVGRMLDEKLQALTQELELAETASENPNINPQDTKAYKLYQKRISEIEEKYKKALEESKEDIENFDDEAPRKAQINVTTPWEQLPKELTDILQPKFETYVAGKDVDEADMYDFRQNWLLTQNAEIQKFLTTSVGVSEKPLEVSEKIPKLKTIPKEQQDQLDKSDVSNLSFTVGLRKILERRLNPKKKEEKPTKQQKVAIEADIEALQKYINYQRSVASPAERLQSIADDFVQTIEELQKEVGEVVVNGRRQNYVLDEGKETETIPQRATELTEEIEMSITPEKPPYIYYGLNDPLLLAAISELSLQIKEGIVKKEGAIDTFINTINQLRAIGKLTAFTDLKVQDVRGLLYLDAVKKGILTKDEALLGLTAAKMASSEYAKTIKEYEAPEKESAPTKTTAPTTDIEAKRADIERRREEELNEEQEGSNAVQTVLNNAIDKIKNKVTGFNYQTNSLAQGEFVTLNKDLNFGPFKKDDKNIVSKDLIDYLDRKNTGYVFGKANDGSYLLEIRANLGIGLATDRPGNTFRIYMNINANEKEVKDFAEKVLSVLKPIKPIENFTPEEKIRIRKDLLNIIDPFIQFDNYKEKDSLTAYTLQSLKEEFEDYIKKNETLTTQPAVRLYRIENKNIPYDESREGIVSKKEIVGGFFTDNIETLSNYIRKNQSQEGINLVYVDISKDDLDKYHVSKNEYAKDMDVEADNWILPSNLNRNYVDLSSLSKVTGNIMTLSKAKQELKSIIENLPTSQAELAALEGTTSTTDETDLEEFEAPIETLDISTVLNILGDVANQESSDVGIVVDDMIRDFLAFKDPNMPSYMTKNHPAYQALFGPKGIITEIRDKVLEGKWTILSDHIKVFDRTLGPKNEDGKPIGLAGEVDLVYIDNETGEIEIIDIKTAKPANWTYWNIDKEIKGLEVKLEQKKKDLADKANAKRESFIKKDIEELEGKLVSAKKKWSKKLNYSIQQTIYRNLIYRMTGKMPRAIKILPLSVDYSKDGVINKISIPTDVTDKDAKGVPGMFITLDPVAEVEKYVPIGKVKDTIEPAGDQEFKETEVLSNQISYNLGKSFVYNGRTGVLIKNVDGTYALDTPSEIIDISINGNNKINPDTTLDTIGLTPIKIIQRPFTIANINGVEHTITELDAEDDTIIVDGVKYKVTRTAKKRTVNGVEFMSNQKQIDELDARIRMVSDDIVKRQTEGEIEGEDINTFTRTLAERKVELESLNAQRADLVANNKIRKITGTNATDILYLINQSPEIFLQNPPKDIEEENEDLDDIKSLFPSDASFKEVYSVMKTRPEALSKLINGEYTGNEQDIEAIKNWIAKSITTLSFSKNDVSAAIVMLTKLMNEVELIKLTKNGKISKRQPKGLFERQNPERRPGSGVSNVQESGAGSTERVPGQPSSKKGTINPEEAKQIIEGVKRKNKQPTKNLSQTLSTLGTDQDKEGYEEIRERIMKADESELDAIETNLFMKALRQEITVSARAIEELIAERRFQLQENVTVKDVKKNQIVVSIAPTIGFSKDAVGEELSEGGLFKVIKVSEKSVTLQYLDNKKIKLDLTASEFNKKFKPVPKENKPKTVKKPITKEYQEVSLDVSEELDKFAQNQAQIQDIQNQFGDMTEDEADNAFMDAVKQCKTKTKK